MNMRAMDDIRDMFCKEAEEYAELGELTPNKIEVIRNIVATIKDINEIGMMKNGSGYTRDGAWEADMRGSYGRGGGYTWEGRGGDGGRDGRDGGNYSMRRGQRRDSMGRYTRDGAKDTMMEHLEQMMDQAQTQEQREAIQRCMDQIERV